MISNVQNSSIQTILVFILCILIGILWKFVPHPAVAIAIALIPIASLIILNQPFLMVLLFVVFSFFRIHEVFPQLYNLKIPLLLSMASLGALIWHVSLTRTIKPYWRKELTMVSLFFALVLVGIFIASNRPVALEYFKGTYWKIIVMTFAITWLSRTASDFNLTSKLITFFGVLVGLVALYNSINGISLVEGTRVTIGRNIGSILGDPNDLALVLMFPVAFAISLVMTKRLNTSTKIYGLFSVIILFSAIIATQSRGGLLGVMMVFGVYGYRYIKSKSLFFIIGIIAAIALFVLAGISERASGGVAEVGIDESAMGRLYAWEAAFGMALDNPLTGVGINNFFSNYFAYSPHWDGLNHAVHSTWFGVLAETGILGLIIFLSLMIMLVRTSIYSLYRIEQNLNQVDPVIHASAQAVFAGLLGTVVSATFLTQGFTWPIYILLALVVAIAQWVDSNLPARTENTSKG